jgi:glucose-1-phosphate adenylyltransferase
VPIGEAHRFGILALGESDAVVDWEEKPAKPKSDLASMGIYVFSKKALLRWLRDDLTDFGRDVIPAMLDDRARVFGYRFDGYWQDVAPSRSYWQTNMDLLVDRPQLDLYDATGHHTRSEERSGHIGATASIHNSLISPVAWWRARSSSRSLAGRSGRHPAPSCATAS